jgi:O-antigen/teichoic acid export membrane protein
MNEAIDEKKEDIRGLADLILISVLLLIGFINLVFLPVLDLVFPEDYRSASLYIPILSVAFVWRALSAFNVYSVYLNKATKYLLVNQLINLIVFIIVVFPLFEHFQLSGIAIAVLIARFTDFIILKLLSNKLKRLPFKMWKYGSIALILSFSAIAINRLSLWDLNPYLLNAIPLLIVFLSFILVLRKELPNLKRILIYRKELF